MTSASDRLPDNLFQRFQNIFGHTLLEQYGMSETSMNLSNHLLCERWVGSVGICLWESYLTAISNKTRSFSSSNHACSFVLPSPVIAISIACFGGDHVFSSSLSSDSPSSSSFSSDSAFALSLSSFASRSALAVSAEYLVRRALNSKSHSVGAFSFHKKARASNGAS